MIFESFEAGKGGSASEELVGEFGFVVVVFVGLLVVIAGFVETEHFDGVLGGLVGEEVVKRRED